MIQIGDLAICNGLLNTRRIVLVTGLDKESGIARILLTTNAVEYATDLDLIVGPADSGYSVPLVIQAELYGSVFTHQLIEVVGELSYDTVESISKSLWSDGESLSGYQVGFPLRYIDPRSGFKEKELDALEALVTSCHRYQQEKEQS